MEEFVSNDGFVVLAESRAEADSKFASMSAAEKKQFLPRVESHANGKPVRIGGCATYVMPVGGRFEARSLNQAVEIYEHTSCRKLPKFVASSSVKSTPVDHQDTSAQSAFEHRAAIFAQYQRKVAVASAKPESSLDALSGEQNRDDAFTFRESIFASGGKSL